VWWCSPHPSSESWIKMEGQFSRGVRSIWSLPLPIVWNCFQPSSDRLQLDSYSLSLVTSSIGPSILALSHLLVLFLLLARGNKILNLCPAAVRPTTPKCPCSVWSREVGRTSIQCSLHTLQEMGPFHWLSEIALRSVFSQGDVGLPIM